MDLTYTSHTHNGWTVLSIVGELDLHTSPQLKEAMAEQGTHIVLDLSQVPFMDSSSLGVIVACLKQVRDEGGDLALMGLQDSPRKVLALTGLDEAFSIVETLDQLPEA